MKNFSFSLLTINTWKCDGNYRQRMALLKEQLGRLQPDVIACQEVFKSSDADTGHELAEALGMHYTFAPARYKPRLFEGQLTASHSGLGLLSTVPILKTETLLLPTHPHDGERLAQFAWLQANSFPVVVINTHLTHLPGQSELRQQQLSTLLAHPALTDPNQVVLLCGDFNAEQHSAEIQFLLTHPTVSIRNAYALGNGIPPGYTMHTRTGNRREPTERSPGRCIDFIFSLTTAGGQHPAISEARVVLDSPDATGNFPSDHCGVFIRTKLLAS